MEVAGSDRRAQTLVRRARRGGPHLSGCDVVVADPHPLLPVIRGSCLAVRRRATGSTAVPSAASGCSSALVLDFGQDD
jgi:hypothetical protein